MQASFIALGVGFHLRNVTVPAPEAWWPYLLFGYAGLAIVVPWLQGCYGEDELRPRYSLFLGVIFALPFWLAARWLADSPYRAIVVGCEIMVALWGMHLLLSLSLWLRDRRRPA